MTTRKRAASRPPTRRRRRADLEAKKLLSALEECANAVIEIAHEAAADSGRGNFQLYYRFRESVQDFESLGTLVEHRLRALGSSQDPTLDEKFFELTAYMLGATISTSLHFLRLFAARDDLPVGSKEVFMREQRSLEIARERMQRSPYDTRLGEHAAADVDAAEEIVAALVDRAPSLIDLSEGAPDA